LLLVGVGKFMSSVLQIRLRPDDAKAHDRLGDIINLQTAADRLARRRHFWTALVATASIPLWLFVFRWSPARDLPGWVLAVWAGAFLAAAGAGLGELRCRRRLRSLLAHAGTSMHALESRS
jgi:hypothetical protein